MRIGTLARKLSVKPAQIVSFLETEFQSANAGAHTRLNEEHVRAVLRHFKADALFAGIELIDEEPEVQEEKAAPESSAPASAWPTEPEGYLAEATPAPEEKPEVIKAPKIELQGLKVLGKIDLPEPKKKEGTAETPPAETTGKRHDRPRKPGNRTDRERKPHRTERKPTPAELREQEAKAEIEKRKKEAEQRKEQRAYRYLSQVKKGTLKHSRMRTVRQEKIDEPTPQRPAPKTWLGKVIRWFTT